MRIGVLGAGQLGRMLALAGAPLGLRSRCLAAAGDTSAREVAEALQGEADDPQALARFLEGIDVVTFESESLPVAALQISSKRVPVFPPERALLLGQDRLNEKRLFTALDIPVAAFRDVDSRAELATALESLGRPAVLKTRRGGYDGKGQHVLHADADIDDAWKRLGGSPLILEEHVPFSRELSLIGVRSRSGETAFYPLVQNVHASGILRLSIAPAPNASRELEQQARDFVLRLFAELDYVGVLALELFQCGDRLLANEMAPRVHNSGHWTIEGAETSQFENHLRAIAGLPLGRTDAIAPCAMVNLLGELPRAEHVLAIPGAHLHVYGKRPAPNRKLGHVTVRARDRAELALRLRDLARVVPLPTHLLDSLVEES